MQQKRKEIFAQCPNLVLLHAGTNDVNADPPEEPYETTPQRLSALVDFILEECPSTVLLLAQIIDAEHSQPRVDAYNAEIPKLVEKYQKGDEWQKVMVVDHRNVGGKNLADGLHPNDHGYRMMAKNWFKAMERIPEGWIQPPQAQDTLD